ncbi:PilC/PilY family type IV pilus protein [uncultured Luteimonas sp.]|uniref:pilus assembly protein n=1 Tax=uncultured Luteimonas sp. TaxID=453144 RepID=UPI0026053A0C|nr:PilC/PilY family type IV pilus protein [uncultured Luteimonas sp.]
MQLKAALASLLATLVALPAAATLPIPDDPLTTGSRVAPNILFILDDSGSMAFDYMPDSIPSTSPPNVARYAYTRNTLSYNPATTYRPWVQANGLRMTGGTSYRAAYGSFNRVGGGTIDLGDSGSCRRFNYNNNATTDEFDSWSNSGTRVCGGRQTFYVPKDTAQTGATYLGNGTNYYRYDILEGGTDIVRSVWGQVVQSNNGVAVSPDSGSVRRNDTNTHNLATVPANGRLTVNISSSSRSVDYELRNPGGGAVCSGTVDEGNAETCTVSQTDAGAYSLVVRRWDRRNNNASYSITASHQTSNRCGTGTGANDWIDCSPVLPSSRTLDQELSNYATWFSYHRSRMKAAKAGASEAFATLDGKVRVGFRAIWGRSGTTFNIPVGDGNDGRFIDSTGDVTTTSRSTWYSRLQSVIGYNGTPLHGALDDAGEYFSDSSSSGPYGPQAGNGQYSCRQNFAILTTDGYWNNVGINVHNQDNSDGSAITGPRGKSYQYSPSAPYQDSYSNTLADVAMKYWKTDLRTDLANNVPSTENVNPAFWQHMVTFGISIGLAGRKGWSAVSDVPSDATWNDPTDTEDADRIDDLLHAAVNSRGAFVPASNPDEFTSGLRQALSAIQQRTSTYSNVATNSVSLDSDTMTFSASYVAGTWTGTVNARRVTRTGVSSEVEWVSSIPTSGRKVFTTSGTVGTSFPTTAQETALARTGGPANYEVSGEDNADYIRGDTSLEDRRGVGNLRNRTSLLGDIIGSSPAYVKDTDTLYVGANDGMLHAFDASTGRELFAYVPGIINIHDLATLSRGDYAHKWFVDGPVAVTSRQLTTNRNVLVGTLGKGGKGLYALDVTDPEGATAAGLFKWERAETPGNNMGLVMGRPILASVGGTPSVVIGNGINSTRGRAVLVVMNADTGAVIKEIDTGAGSVAQPNGLSAPVGVYGADGRTLRYAYAGDMLGNVWKFDLTAEASSAWSATRLFTASDSSGNAQPISAGLTLAVDPRTRKRWVFFGTGRFLTVEDADPENATTQSMYGFIEGETALDRSDLTTRTLAVTSGSSDGYAVRAFEDKAPLPEGSMGWYIDLPADGERIVQDAQRVSNVLVTASMMPTGDACEAAGSGYINALDAFTGTSTGSSFFDLDNDGSTADQTVADKPVGSVDYGVGMPTLPNLLRGLLVVSGTDIGGDEASGAGAGRGSGTAAMRWDRVSWREVRSE